MLSSSRLTRWLALAMLGTAPLLSACIGGESGPAWSGPPFSADLVDPRQPDKPGGHLYLSDGKLRFESTDTASPGALVLDPARWTTLLINDQKKEYFDAGMFTSVVTKMFGPVLAFFRPAGAGDPCTQWNSRAMPFASLSHDKSDTPTHFTCTSLGTESVDGRAAHKWKVTSDDKDSGSGTAWIDDRLQIVSKWTGSDGDGMEMRNIKEGTVPASMFAAPPSYKKLSVSSILSGMMSGSDKGSHP